MFPFVALNQDSLITIPIATYSYSEIGSLLSSSKERVELANSVKDRGALLGLQTRTMSEAIDIVCDGLDLVPFRIRTGLIRLDPNPDIEKRERRWRESFLENLTRRWVVVQDLFAQSSNLDHSEVMTRQALLKPGREDVESDVFYALAFQGTWKIALKAGAILGASIPPDFRDEFLASGHQADTSTTILGSNYEERMMKEMRLGGKPVEPAIIERELLRYPGCLQIQSNAAFTLAPSGAISILIRNGSLSMGEASLQVDCSRTLFHDLVLPEPNYQIPGLGPDAVAWLEKTNSSTRAALGSRPLSDPVHVPMSDVSLSGAIERWAKTHNQEVVMELAPLTESLNFSNATVVQKAPTGRISNILKMDDAWSLDESHKVLVVRDRMAFLDHAIPCPTGAIAHFERVSPGRSGNGVNPHVFADNNPSLPLVENLLPLVRIRVSADVDPRFWFDYSGYRGLSDGYLLAQSLLLWPFLPNDALAQMKVQPQGEMRIPLSLFPDTAMQEVAEAMGGRYADAHRIREILDQLQVVKLFVSWKHDAKGDETLVTTDFDNINDETLQTSNCALFKARL